MKDNNELFKQDATMQEYKEGHINDDESLDMDNEDLDEKTSINNIDINGITKNRDKSTNIEPLKQSGKQQPKIATLEEINKNNKFFMAMNQYAEHSYLTLGYMEDDNPVILNGFGKYFDIGSVQKKSFIQKPFSIIKQLFSSSGREAFLKKRM